jgi:class 3 adenylate cyclase
VLRRIFEDHSGHIFKTAGDASCVAFSSPSDALAASLAAQRGLHNEVWGETPPKVRVGLHTGEAEERDGDYFGPPLNRAARLMGASEALLEEMGIILQVVELILYDRDVAFVRQQLGEERFNLLRAEGRAMTLDEAAEFALAELRP